jgi:hypothetical protein
MPPSSIRVLTENLPEERALQAIFRDELERGSIEVQSLLTSSAALGVAEYSLLEHPDRPIALVLNAGDEDPMRREERRDTIHRILTNASTSGWHVALAVPDVEAWFMADPFVRATFDADEAARSSRHERAVRIGPLARRRSIDRESICREFPEFQALAEFLERSARALQTLAEI